MPQTMREKHGEKCGMMKRQANEDADIEPSSNGQDLVPRTTAMLSVAFFMRSTAAPTACRNLLCAEVLTLGPW